MISQNNVNNCNNGTDVEDLNYDQYGCTHSQTWSLQFCVVHCLLNQWLMPLINSQWPIYSHEGLVPRVATPLLT